MEEEDIGEAPSPVMVLQDVNASLSTGSSPGRGRAGRGRGRGATTHYPSGDFATPGGAASRAGGRCVCLDMNATVAGRVALPAPAQRRRRSTSRGSRNYLER